MTRPALAELLRTEHSDNADPEIGFALISTARRPEFLDQRIPGSLNIPLEEEEQIEKRFAKTKKIILYSGTESQTTASQAAATLEAMGFKDITVYEGGLADWEQAGEELERGRGQETIVEIPIA